jgi:hypothetical protein
VVEEWAAKTQWALNLNDQENQHDAVTLARALLWLKTGGALLLDEVTATLAQLVTVDVTDMKNLALSRNLTGYLVAADLIGYHDEGLKAWARAAVDKRTWNAFTQEYSLRASALEIPTNGGAHSRAAVTAAALTSGDTALLEEMAARMFDFLGGSGAGWRWSGEGAWMPDPADESSWRCVLPAGASIRVDGFVLSLDGVIPGDQTRAGPPKVPPQVENYVREGQQGTLAACWMLHRAGFPAFEWQDQALLRSFRWFVEEAGGRYEGDDAGLPYLVRKVYGPDWVVEPPRPGKNAVGLIYPLLK